MRRKLDAAALRAVARELRYTLDLSPCLTDDQRSRGAGAEAVLWVLAEQCEPEPRRRWRREK